MRFEQLKHRVARREQLLEGRLLQTREQWQTLTTTWRDSWTPLRIVVAGLISGFVVGRSDPVHTLGKLGALGGSGTKILQLVATLSGLFASAQASSAADQAEHAADKADEVATDAGVQAPRAAGIAATPPEPVVVAPRPAEAATELSEP